MDGWHEIIVRQILFDEQGYDVAVFVTENYGTVSKLVVEPLPGILLGDELKFLGFPQGLANTYPGQEMATPLVRTAFFSGVIKIQGLDLNILDGFNNPGFSGGPIYARDYSSRKIGLFGVISGFRPENERHARIYRRGDDGSEIEVPDLYTKPNSGMINAVGAAQVARLAGQLASYNAVKNG